MTNDPIGVLERELVEAARRRIGIDPRSRRVRRLGSGLAAAILIATTLVVAGSLILLGGHRRAAGPAAGEPGRQQLIAALGVLRRPQSSADLHSAAIEALLARYNVARAPWDRFGRPDLPLIRRVTVTPWGQDVFLVPVRSAPDRRQEALLVMLGHHSLLDCCATAADIETGGELINAGQATSRQAGRNRPTIRFLAVVPDNVTKVELVLPQTAAAGASTTRSVRVAAPVHNNVAAVQISRGCCDEVPIIFWFGSTGNVIRRIGDLAGSYRFLAVSPPAPETPLSRAAERDPSTPNPVWITPASGGRRTVFTIHFRVLLNAANYDYQMGGACQPPIGTVGHPDDSRGQIWSDHLEPTAGASWCPGTYHVSVAVTDPGPSGTLKRLAKPFGTAVFTVR